MTNRKPTTQQEPKATRNQPVHRLAYDARLVREFLHMFVVVVFGSLPWPAPVAPACRSSAVPYGGLARETNLTAKGLVGAVGLKAAQEAPMKIITSGPWLLASNANETHLTPRIKV